MTRGWRIIPLILLIWLVVGLAWRLVNFWLPIPVGTACYVSLRAGAHASRKARRAAVEDLVGAAEAGRTDRRTAS